MDSSSEPKPFDRRFQGGVDVTGPRGNDGTISILQLQQQKAETQASLAFAKYQYVDVTFTTANADLLVAHKLTPVNPDDVAYVVVGVDRDAVIYNDRSSTRQPWGAGYILLRSSAANATASLLIILKRLPSADRT